MAENREELTLIVRHLKEDLHCTALPTSTVAELKTHLAERLSLPVEFQKLVFRGKVLADEDTLAASNITNGTKLQLLATARDVVEAAIAVPEVPALAARPPQFSAVKESEKARKRQEALEPPRIHRIEVLDLPEKEYASKLLQRLVDDRGIKEIMKRHGWHVALLKELTPLNLKLAGYNRGRGAEIAVKLRKLDGGWQGWPDIQETMLHELAHCDHDEHDANFHKLNRQLNKEIVSLNWTKVGGQKLGGDIDSYNPDPKYTEDWLADKNDMNWREATASAQRLGGHSPALTGLTPAQAAALAAQMRLTQREQELVNTCGASATATGAHKEATVPVAVAVPEATVTQPTAPAVQAHPVAVPTLQPQTQPQPQSQPPQQPQPLLHTPDCPICGASLPGASERFINNHVLQCIGGNSQPNSTHAEPSAGSHCPVCNVQFPADATERYMSNHIERCLAG
eukprot:TRINITY_DN6201_c0_g1_i1.p1 TRINITY_DN6201_c0_g1~~TRINITY_DN6201_c0_g1_i1.p1  ORF type:complete len:455 (-),score=75.30 TRINITY_DN6201_c0_g1_i1:53-1417(-)